ncbi:MAG: aliphatic sulfonate ABC transporter substrate-binding protein [Phycisphaerae bacterium]
MREFRVLLTAVGLIMCAGCNPPSAPQGETGTGGRANLAEVRIGYFANLTHAQAVLGVASGEFAAAVKPSTLSTKVFNAGPSLIEALFADEIDIGYVGPSPALNAHAKSHGQGIRIVAGAAANGVAIVVRKDAGIERLDDLKGKRIATPQLGNTQDVSARHFLINKLGQPNADNVIPVANAEQLAMMDRGQIDAAWAPEPWAARLIVEARGKLLAEEKELWPGGEFTLAVIVVSPRFLSEHPDTVKAILRVHQTLTARLNHEPDKCAAELGAALNKLTGKTIPPAAFSQAMQRTKFTTEPLAETLKTFATWAFEMGLSKDAPDLAGLVDTTILRSITE